MTIVDTSGRQHHNELEHHTAAGQRRVHLCAQRLEPRQAVWRQRIHLQYQAIKVALHTQRHNVLNRCLLLP